MGTLFLNSPRKLKASHKPVSFLLFPREFRADLQHCPAFVLEHRKDLDDERNHPQEKHDPAGPWCGERLGVRNN